MALSATELMRNYAEMIREAEEDLPPTPAEDTDTHDANNPFAAKSQDSSKPEPDSEPEPEDEENNMNQFDSDDPVWEMASDISDTLRLDVDTNDIVREIHSFLERNNLEITPIGGLTNKQGNV